MWYTPPDTLPFDPPFPPQHKANAMKIKYHVTKEDPEEAVRDWLSAQGHDSVLDADTCVNWLTEFHSEAKNDEPFLEVVVDR